MPWSPCVGLRAAQGARLSQTPEFCFGTLHRGFAAAGGGAWVWSSPSPGAWVCMESPAITKWGGSVGMLRGLSKAGGGAPGPGGLSQGGLGPFQWPEIQDGGYCPGPHCEIWQRAPAPILLPSLGITLCYNFQKRMRVWVRAGKSSRRLLSV